MFDCASSLPVVGIVTPVEVDPVLTGVFGTTTVPVFVDPVLVDEGFVLEKIVFPFQVQVSCVDFGSFSYFFHVLSHTALASVSAILYLADLSIEKLVFIVSVPRVIVPVDANLPVLTGVAGFGMVVVPVLVPVTTFVPYHLDNSFPFQMHENLLVVSTFDARFAQ